MEKILCLNHTQPDGSLSNHALETVSAAIAISKGLEGSSLAVGLLGEDVRGAAESLAGCGASRLVGVSGADFAVSRYGSDRSAMEALARTSEATLVVAPATSRVSRALPGVAQRLGGRIDTGITGILLDSGSLQIQRWYYRRRMVATLSRSQRPWFISIDPGVFEPWPPRQGDSGSASLEAVDVPSSEAWQRTRVQGVEAAAADAETIRPDAELLFVAGAGWTKKQADGQTHVKEAENLILDFIGKTKASLGGSKSLVDQSGEGEAVLSFMSHLNQVGQTGATPRHPKGLSTCCHGEEPHVVGWRFINERRAVNTDPNCGWAQGKADVLYVADAFQVMAKLNEILGED